MGARTQRLARPERTPAVVLSGFVVSFPLSRAPARDRARACGTPAPPSCPTSVCSPCLVGPWTVGTTGSRRMRAIPPRTTTPRRYTTCPIPPRRARAPRLGPDVGAVWCARAGWRLVPAVQEPEGGPRAHLLRADPGFGANAPEFYADLCLCVSVRFLPTPALQGLLRLISGPHGSDSARGTPCRPHVTVSAVFSISEPCHGTTGVFRAMLRGVCALSTSRVPKWCAQDFWAKAVGGAKSARKPAGLLDGTVLLRKTDPHQQRVPQCSACRPSGWCRMASRAGVLGCCRTYPRTSD